MTNEELAKAIYENVGNMISCKPGTVPGATGFTDEEIIKKIQSLLSNQPMAVEGLAEDIWEAITYKKGFTKEELRLAISRHLQPCQQCAEKDKEIANLVEWNNAGKESAAIASVEIYNLQSEVNRLKQENEELRVTISGKTFYCQSCADKEKENLEQQR